MPLIHALLPRSSLGCARGLGSPSLAEAPHLLLIAAIEKPAAPPSHPGMWLWKKHGKAPGENNAAELQMGISGG